MNKEFYHVVFCEIKHSKTTKAQLHIYDSPDFVSVRLGMKVFITLKYLPTSLLMRQIHLFLLLLSLGKLWKDKSLCLYAFPLQLGTQQCSLLVPAILSRFVLVWGKRGKPGKRGEPRFRSDMQMSEYFLRILYGWRCPWAVTRPRKLVGLLNMILIFFKLRFTV